MTSVEIISMLRINIFLLLLIVRRWPNNQTLFVKYVRIANHSFERFAASQNISRRAKFAGQCFWKNSATLFPWIKQKMFDEQCFTTWQTVKHFAWHTNFKCLTMFDRFARTIVVINQTFFFVVMFSTLFIYSCISIFIYIFLYIFLHTVDLFAYIWR